MENAKRKTDAGINAARLLVWRELRGEKRLLALAAATIAAATAGLALVLALAETFERGRLQQSRALLGGDYSLRLSQRDFSEAEIDYLQGASARFSRLRAARVLALHGEQTQLARLKGVDKNYPLFGEWKTQAGAPAASVFEPPQNGEWRAVVGKSLLPLLGLAVGDVFAAGGLSLRVVGVAANEPDPDPRLWAGAPPIFVDIKAMQSGAFAREGALLSRFARVALPPQTDGKQWASALAQKFPDAGWRLRGPERAQSNVRRVVEQTRDFLALAALAAMLVAGIGCGNAVSAFMRARARGVAVIKMIGGNGAFVRRVYLSIAAGFAVLGAAVGAAAGAALLFAVAPAISAFLPFPLSPVFSVEVAARAFLTALLLAAAFAAPPAMRFARINPLALFAAAGSDAQAPPPARADRLAAGGALLLAALALPLAWDKKIMLLAVAAVAGLLYAVALAGAGWAQKRAGGGVAWRLGMLAIARNRAQTAAAVMSFGVGVFVLTAALNTEKNFSARIEDTLRQKAPALFLVGALPSQAARLTAIVKAAGGRAQTLPFVRGRVLALGGRKAEEVVKTAPREERWILRGDRGITWSAAGDIGGSRVTHGTLWAEDVEGLQASFDLDPALAFGLQLGDKLELNVVGRRVTAVITSFREIDWQTLGVNFVIILNRSPFAGAPHTRMGAVFLDESKTAPTQLQIARELPNITPIATAPIFDAAKNLLARAAALLQSVAVFLLLAGLPMLAAAVLESRRRRLDVAVVLRLLGAKRGAIVAAGLWEFLFMAALAVLPALLLGALAGRIIVTEIFELPWRLHLAHLLAVAAACLLVFLGMGVGDIARAAKAAPYPRLRNE